MHISHPHPDRNFSPIKAVLLPALFLTSAATALPTHSKPTDDRQSYKVYVDKEGVMRRSDTKEEVSYYGTNYTTPFAHAYRALGYLGVDRKNAIDRDVYHMSRLGFNGFRLHLWDAELADSAGNLLSNDHLDLLDYLIAQLEKRGIDIVLTAQTNFGNGYPEKNIDTGAFTYDFTKCEIHENPIAQKIQANYLDQLARHVNPYTGRSYAADNAIIAMEINNEPCHSGTKKQVTAYINKMAKTLRKAGFDKPILYNVSHNGDVTEAYYDADIQGTTYQWYPTGLVAGHERKGNFLPAVDEYAIPWKNTIPNYGKMARVVYEFDPGDILYSYMYPAIARTFRKEGFQWITQFAYDPTDMARFNTEYQTHFLNLAYTPSKALSMLIAGEVARQTPRHADYGTFPADTTFGNFRVSYAQDLSELNSPDKFYYSNPTRTSPQNAATLRHIAGAGSSPIVKYDGTGAYFLDATEHPGVWRLEIMPDVMIVSDPFEKPSLSKEVGKIVYRNHPMTIDLPQLGKRFSYINITSGDISSAKPRIADGGTIDVYPGVYLLSENEASISSILSGHREALNELGEYVAPENTDVSNIVVHTPAQFSGSDSPLTITAEVFGTTDPESVVVYPSTVSFWREDNETFPMTKGEGFTYTATIPAESMWGDSFSYNIVVKENGKQTTWPSGESGNPLDWDHTGQTFYTTRKAASDDAAVLLMPKKDDRNIETAMIPEAWDFRLTPSIGNPRQRDSYRLESTPQHDGMITVRRYVGDELTSAPQLEGKTNIVVSISDAEGIDGAEIALVSKNGATYSAPLPLRTGSQLHAEEQAAALPSPENEVSLLHADNISEVLTLTVPLESLRQRSTLIIPAPYPSFLQREVNLGEMPFDIRDIDFVELIIPTHTGRDIRANLHSIHLE